MTKCHTAECPHIIWPEDHFYPDAFSEELRDYCFRCAFWLSKSRNMDAGSVVAERQGGREYWHFDPERPVMSDVRPELLGCGGAMFTVLFTDGRVVKTNNLWGGGEIPEEFCDLFPVNAWLTVPKSRYSPATR